MSPRPSPLDPEDSRLKNFLPGPTNPDTAAQIAAHRAELAEKRKLRPKERGQDRRKGERRAGDFERREGDRRAEIDAAMAPTLAKAAKKQAEAKYAPEPAAPSAFMDSLK